MITTVKKDKYEYLGVGLLTDPMRALIEQFLLTTKEHFIQLHAGRGVGKTYTTQKTVIEDCLANDTEFIFCVPTKKQKEGGILRKWLAKSLYREFLDWQKKYTNEYFYMRQSDDEDWRLVGRCLPLSGAEDEGKLDSSVFRVNWMIWDESMKMKLDINAGNFLIDLFLTAYHTIDRDENRVKAVFIGNLLNKLDPSYEFFNVTIPHLKREGVIVRSFNKISWAVPMPPDLKDNENNTFRKMIAGTRYGEIASGKFNMSYGDLIGDPGDNPVNSCYGVQFTDDGYLLIMSSGGKIYIEACSRPFAETYATQIFTTITKEATQEKLVVPIDLINIIRKALTLGRCKFVDEESLLSGAARLKMAFNIQIL